MFVYWDRQHQHVNWPYWLNSLAYQMPNSGVYVREQIIAVCQLAPGQRPCFMMFPESCSTARVVRHPDRLQLNISLLEVRPTSRTYGMSLGRVTVEITWERPVNSLVWVLHSGGTLAARGRAAHGCDLGTRQLSTMQTILASHCLLVQVSACCT